MTDPVPQVVLTVREDKKKKRPQPFVIVPRPTRKPRAASIPLQPVIEAPEEEKEGRPRPRATTPLVTVPLSPDLSGRVQQLEQQHSKDQLEITRLALHNQRLEDAIVSQCLTPLPPPPRDFKKETSCCVIGVLFSAGILTIAALALWLVYYYP
jgi:hypothetical protein